MLALASNEAQLSERWQSLCALTGRTVELQSGNRQVRGLCSGIADDGALLDEPYVVSFLTAAAPNLSAIMTSQPEAAASVPGLLAARAERVLAVAAARCGKCAARDGLSG